MKIYVSYICEPLCWISIIKFKKITKIHNLKLYILRMMHFLWGDWERKLLHLMWDTESNVIYYFLNLITFARNRNENKLSSYWATRIRLEYNLKNKLALILVIETLFHPFQTEMVGFVRNTNTSTLYYLRLKMDEKK